VVLFLVSVSASHGRSRARRQQRRAFGHHPFEVAQLVPHIRHREPRLDALKKLAAAFGVTVDALLEGHGEPEKPATKKKPKK
jgi:hypothetical protein